MFGFEIPVKGNRNKKTAHKGCMGIKKGLTIINTKALVWDTTKLKGESVQAFLKRTAVEKSEE